MSKRGRALASISIDIDPVDTHLSGYGFEDKDPCDLVYRKAVPRLLDLLDELGVRATLFVVARDAASEAPLLREVVARGHEVASHSWSHAVPFRGLDDAALTWELEGSRAALEHATGHEVVGFRAPAWDVDERVLAGLVKAGYRYDASIFPTPVLAASRLVAWMKGAGKGSVLGMQVVGHALAPTRPHEVSTLAGPLVELPIAVTPWLRLPYYHTFAYFVPRALMNMEHAALVRSGQPMSYELHAADQLDLQADGVDPRMACHPGMDQTAEKKADLLRSILGRIAKDFEVVTLRELAGLPRLGAASSHAA